MFFLKKPNFIAFKFLFLIFKGTGSEKFTSLASSSRNVCQLFSAHSSKWILFTIFAAKKFDILCNYSPNVKINEPCSVCKLLQSTPNPQPNQPTPAYIRNKKKPRQTDFLPGNLQSLAGLTINTVIVSHNPWYASKNSLPLPLFCRILGAFSVMKQWNDSCVIQRGSVACKEVCWMCRNPLM